MRSLMVAMILSVALMASFPALAQAVDIWFEAENADSMAEGRLKIYPDATGFDPAKEAGIQGEPSRGGYIGTDDGVGNNNNLEVETEGASYTFTCPAGTYAIWARRCMQASGDSFWIDIPDGQYNTPVDSSGLIKWNGLDSLGLDTAQMPYWKWVRVFSDTDRDPDFTVTLGAGQHTIEWINREDGPCLDAFLITDNLYLDPATLPDVIPSQ